MFCFMLHADIIIITLPTCHNNLVQARSIHKAKPSLVHAKKYKEKQRVVPYLFRIWLIYPCDLTTLTRKQIIHPLYKVPTVTNKHHNKILMTVITFISTDIQVTKS